MITIAFTDKTKDSIIAEQTKKGLFLIEEQRNLRPTKNTPAGNWLIFDTSRPVEEVDDITLLKQRVAALEAKIPTLTVPK